MSKKKITSFPGLATLNADIIMLQRPGMPRDTIARKIRESQLARLSRAMYQIDNPVLVESMIDLLESYAGEGDDDVN